MPTQDNNGARPDVVLEELCLSGERGLQLRAKHPAFAALVEQMVEFFRASGGKNYVEVTLFDESLGHMVLTLQRQAGQTPGELVRELKDKLHRSDKSEKSP